jgi:hypothetical protein
MNSGLVFRFDHLVAVAVAKAPRPRPKRVIPSYSLALDVDLALTVLDDRRLAGSNRFWEWSPQGLITTLNLIYCPESS